MTATIESPTVATTRLLRSSTEDPSAAHPAPAVSDAWRDHTVRCHSLSGRLAAACGATAICFHIWVAVMQSHSLAMSALMLVMAVLCMPCVLAAWHSTTRRAVTMLMVLSLSSALAQLVIILAFGSDAHLGHGAHDATAAVGVAPAGAIQHTTYMLLVIVLELVTAAIAAVHVRHLNATTQKVKARAV